MADTKISDLASRTSRSGTELLPVALGGANYKMLLSDILAGLGHTQPYFAADHYLGPQAAGLPAAGAVVADRLCLVPVRVGAPRTFTTLGFVLTTAASAAGAVRLGLYNCRASDMQPTTLIYEGGAPTVVDSGTPLGLKTQTINGGAGVSLVPGMYYLAVNVTGSGIQMQRIGVDTGPFGWFASGTTLRHNTGLYKNVTYGVLPADESAVSYSTLAALGSTLPVLLMR